MWRVGAGVSRGITGAGQRARTHTHTHCAEGVSNQPFLYRLTRKIDLGRRLRRALRERVEPGRLYGVDGKAVSRDHGLLHNVPDCGHLLEASGASERQLKRPGATRLGPAFGLLKLRSGLRA